MSLRICIPSNEIRLAASYARSRAAAGSGPSPVTLSTRPPAVTISPSRCGGPGVGHLGQPRRPRRGRWITSPFEEELRVAGRGEHHGHRPVVGRTPRSVPARPPGSRAARQRSTRSERSRGSTACVSGSPKRTLNSSTLGPSASDHQPGVEDAVEGGARARPSRRASAGARPRRSRSTSAVAEARAPASSCPCRRCSAPGRRRRSACSPGRGRAAPRSRRRRAPAAKAPRPRGTPRAPPASRRSAAR